MIRDFGNSTNNNIIDKVSYTNQAPRIKVGDISRFRKPCISGTIKWSSGIAVNFSFDQSGMMELSSESVKTQSIDFSATQCLGAASGHRHWFVCPICQQRCNTLFLWSLRFACRKCQNLQYAPKTATPLSQARKTELRLRRRLFPQTPNQLYTHAGRPKGMHKRTYDRLMRLWLEAFDRCQSPDQCFSK